MIKQDDVSSKETEKKAQFQNTMIKKLKELGLTKNESKIYICLSENGPQKVLAISKIANIPRTETYLLLRFLKLKGAVKQSITRPVRISAMPIENVIESIIKSHQEKIDQINLKKNEIIDEWNQILIENKSPRSDFSKIESATEKYVRLHEFREEFKRNLKNYRQNIEKETRKNKN